VVEKIMHVLLQSLADEVRNERGSSAKVIALIGEIDQQKLYREEACSSMFVYCVERLNFSEDAAQKRIQVARVARRFPLVLDYLASGKVHLTGLNWLAPHLTETNHREVLDGASYLSKRKIQELCVELAPRELVCDEVYKLPAPAQVAKPARVEPLRPEQYGIHFTANRALKEKLDRARDLLRFQGGSDLATVIDRALTMLLADLEKKRFAKTDKPRKTAAPNTQTRRVPNAIKRAVCERDMDRCTFEDGSGRRCSECAVLEFDHIVPWAVGGETSLDNLRLRCRAHNLLSAEEVFGKH
jgi:hypothetical protein